MFDPRPRLGLRVRGAGWSRPPVGQLWRGARALPVPSTARGLLRTRAPRYRGLRASCLRPGTGSAWREACEACEACERMRRRRRRSCLRASSRSCLRMTQSTRYTSRSISASGVFRDEPDRTQVTEAEVTEDCKGHAGPRQGRRAGPANQGECSARSAASLTSAQAPPPPGSPFSFYSVKLLPAPMAALVFRVSFAFSSSLRLEVGAHALSPDLKLLCGRGGPRIPDPLPLPLHPAVLGMGPTVSSRQAQRKPSHGSALCGLLTATCPGWL